MASNWPDKLKKALKADPRKSALLGTLVIVFAVVGYRTFGGKTALPVSANVASSGSTLARPLPSPRLAGLSDAVPEFKRWRLEPINPLTHNLFAIKYDYFPQDGAHLNSTPRVPDSDLFWDQLAKSWASQADQKKERTVLVENLRLQAAQLHLQSTIMGNTPQALINGQAVMEGDVIDSFRVIRIQSRGVIVEREGIKLEIVFK